jgi:hypothetical protein
MTSGRGQPRKNGGEGTGLVGSCACMSPPSPAYRPPRARCIFRSPSRALRRPAVLPPCCIWAGTGSAARPPLRRPRSSAGSDMSARRHCRPVPFLATAGQTEPRSWTDRHSRTYHGSRMSRPLIDCPVLKLFPFENIAGLRPAGVWGLDGTPCYAGQRAATTP